MAAKTADDLAIIEPDGKEPIVRDEMGEDAFNAMMARGMAQAKVNDSRLHVDIIADIKRDIK